jgi:hypothetical protein
MRIKGIEVTETQADVYAAIKRVGPVADNILVPLVQHTSDRHPSSSGIRTRRAELLAKGLLKPDKVIRTGSGRRAQTYKAVR